MRKQTILSLIFLLLLKWSSGQTFVVDTIAYGGNPDNRVNFLIMGDGYRAADMAQFRTNATTVSNYLLSTPPFSFYPNFFNVFAIEVISTDAGIDHSGNSSDNACGTQPVTSVNNYLNSGFDGGSSGGGGVHRCIYSNQSSLVYSIANTNFPQYDFINVLANTTYYGGCAGGIAYTSVHSSSAEVFVHELGHMFAGLSDEYDYGSTNCNPGTSQNINVSQQTDTSLLVWKKWLTTAPIPTPSGTNCSLIGLYEGAKYCTENWYRPKCNCKMRSLNQPFCEVCKEQLIYKISTLVNYIEDYSPQDPGVTICRNGSQLFTAAVLNSTTGTVRSQWYVDNNLVVNNGTSFLFDGTNFSEGSHQVKLVTLDTTTLVKKTMNSYQRIWNVTVTPALSTVTSSTDAKCQDTDGTATVTPSGGMPNYMNTILGEDWEGTNNWTIVNGSQTNKWIVGTNTSNGGSKSIYISNNSQTNSYSLTSTSTVHFYRNITFPSNAINIKISFDWKGQGEANNDYLRVFLVPTSTNPTAGSQLGSGQIGSTYYNLQDIFTTATITGLDANAGTTKRLVFSWRNNSSSGTQPPAAIDNILITYETPGSYSYVWNTNPPQYTATATSLAPGTYSATVTDLIGCSTVSPDITVGEEDCPISLLVGVFIEGFYAGAGKMRATINAITYPNVCDTVIIELHQPFSPYEIAFTAKNTINTNGNGTFYFPSAVIGNSYYVVVRHRNTLETWSAAPVLMNGTLVVYTFKTSGSTAYGSNQRQLPDGFYAIFSGDVDQDGNIDIDDFHSVEDASHAYSTGYLNTDLTGDGLIETADYSQVEMSLGKILARP